MTPPEQDRLMRLVERIAVQAPEPKEPAAVSALAQLLRRRPDAAYWLLRRCLLLETAIEQALPSDESPPARSGTRREPPAGPGPEPVLRDLLGEFTNTSLLGDLADLPEPAKPPRDASGGSRRS